MAVHSIFARNHEAHHGDDGESARWRPDFRVLFDERRIWRIQVLSERARDWARNYPICGSYSVDQDMIVTDLGGVNGLIFNARLQGYRCEYQGPRQLVRLLTPGDQVGN